MAVQEQTPYIEHIANGVTTSFALEFECKDKEHLIVLVDNVEPNVGTWSLANGSVVFGIAPADGKIISIQRNTPFRRDTNFQSYDNSLRPATINKDFDWIWYKLQELGVADWILGNRIDALKNYVDDRDDELRAYLMEEIRKQGVALDQLDDYYNYLMQRLAQIAVDKGWDSSFVVDASGETQQQVNYNGGSKWHSRVGGYQENERVVLANGDIVKSTIDENTNDPNVDMTGWVNPQKEQDILNDFSVNVDSFARYNTNGDWYNAIDKAINKLITKGGGTLNFNPKTYVLKTPFNKALPDNIKVHIQGVGATIDARTIKGGVAGDTTIFSIGGSVLTNSQLAADVAAMSSDIPLSSNLSLKNGDILKIISTDPFEPSRAYYVKGEFVQVVSVSGNIIKTAGATYDSYTATTTKAEKLAMPSVSIKGLSILCDANQTGLELIYCRNPSAIGCTVNGSRYTGIRFYYCLGGGAEKNDVGDSWYVGTGTSYNIAVASCQDLTVQSNSLREARHNISSGGTMPCRNIKYLYNDCLTHPDNGNFTSIDAHSNGEYFQIVGNTCESIGVSARNIKVKDNIIRSNKSHYQGLLVQPSLNDGWYELEGNDVIMTGANSTAFYFAPVIPNIRTSRLSIKGGSLKSVASAISIKPRVAEAIDNVINKVEIFDTDATGFLVDKYSTTTITINELITNNFKSVTTSGAIVFTAGNFIKKWISTDDRYQRNSLNNVVGAVFADEINFTRLTVSGESAASKARSLQISNTTKVKNIDPKIINCTLGIELMSNVGKYIESGKTQVDATLNITNSAGAAIAESETRTGNLILSATAIPTVGSYTVGDYVRNTANTIITGTPNKRLIGWYRATTGSGHVLGADWIAEYVVLG